MYNEKGLYVAHCANGALTLCGKMANRHGLIAGATGTGKTVTLQVLAETFSQAGVPCFLADMKGDVSGISKSGKLSDFISKRIEEFGLEDPRFSACPTRFYDVFGEQGHPMRATISQMGPLLLSRLLGLNDTQDGVLNAVFRIADERGLEIIDMKDLRKMLDYAAQNAKTFGTQYGNISSASVGAIQRSLLSLESQGADKFFGEPSFNINDLIAREGGQGVMSVLAADKLMLNPKLYSTFMLWLLSELYSQLPETGDNDMPKLVFFFDEVHMLFEDTSRAMVEKVEQVVRLIRSKGVGIFFVTQSPSDIPDNILGQLGNRFQHALRAFTPRDLKAVNVAAETMRDNPDLDEAGVITQLGTGEALVSLLDEKGVPGITERARILFPLSQIGAITEEERRENLRTSAVAGKYDEAVDRKTAYEILMEEEAKATEEEAEAAEKEEKEKEEKEKKKKPGLLSRVLKAVMTAITSTIATILGAFVASKVTGKKSKSNGDVVGRVVKNATAAGSRQITRDILGNMLGKK